MQKVIKLTTLTLITLLIGMYSAAVVFNHFFYSDLVFLTVNLSLVLVLIVSFGKAMNVLDKHKFLGMMFDFSFGMSEPFHAVVKRFQLNSISIVAAIFGFIAYLGYLETKSIGYSIFLSLFLISYIRALLTYQKFKEFR